MTHVLLAQCGAGLRAVLPIISCRVSKQISKMERHESARITLRAVLLTCVIAVIAVNLAGYFIIPAMLLGVLLPLYLYWDVPATVSPLDEEDHQRRKCAMVTGIIFPRVPMHNHGGVATQPSHDPPNLYLEQPMVPPPFGTHAIYHFLGPFDRT